MQEPDSEEIAELQFSKVAEVFGRLFGLSDESLFHNVAMCAKMRGAEAVAQRRKALRDKFRQADNNLFTKSELFDTDDMVTYYTSPDLFRKKAAV
jgi:hypothetical protein